MCLLEISIDFRMYIGIAAMAVLFVSFVIAMVTAQRKKLQFHTERQRLLQAQQDILTQQNRLLEQKVAERTEELEVKNKALEKSLTDLNNAQEQLIQREKLASLGELTAGIAHEIKNPLNFVNNFSDVSVELFEELKEEIKAGQWQAANAVIEDLQGNLQKISMHGKRADSIVKGMLAHARTGNGLKEPVNINDLVDECIRLSYQGMKAKFKGFNVDIKESYDTHIPSMELNSQEIGRVIINLCNNALYAMERKSKTPGNDNYEPVLQVSTRRRDAKIAITIEDNGMGIEPSILHKIFQPFFTTKPTGEGTGLGLSMSYEIITQGHKGEMKVDSKAGQFARFTILLPLA